MGVRCGSLTSRLADVGGSPPSPPRFTTGFQHGDGECNGPTTDYQSTVCPETDSRGASIDTTGMDAPKEDSNEKVASLAMHLQQQVLQGKTTLGEGLSVENVYHGRQTIDFATQQITLDHALDNPYIHRDTSLRRYPNHSVPLDAFERMLQARYQLALFQQVRYGTVDLAKLERVVLPSSLNLKTSPPQPQPEESINFVHKARVNAARRQRLPRSRYPQDELPPRPPPTPDDGGYEEARIRVMARAAVLRGVRNWLARSRKSRQGGTRTHANSTLAADKTPLRLPVLDTLRDCALPPRTLGLPKKAVLPNSMAALSQARTKRHRSLEKSLGMSHSLPVLRTQVNAAGGQIASVNRFR